MRRLPFDQTLTKVSRGASIRVALSFSSANIELGTECASFPPGCDVGRYANAMMAALGK